MINNKQIFKYFANGLLFLLITIKFSTQLIAFGEQDSSSGSSNSSSTQAPRFPAKFPPYGLSEEERDKYYAAVSPCNII